jgi:hypothetical protein
MQFFKSDSGTRFPVWSWAGFALALSLFLAAACYRLDRPGVYADEALFVGAAYKMTGECEIDAQVSKTLQCLPLYMQPPYLGVTKAALYAPIFAIFGSGPVPLRLPMILLTALGLFALFVFLQKQWGSVPAAITLGLLALDPIFVYHIRFDWGPAAIAVFCRIALAICTLKWLENGRMWALRGAVFFALLGFYDKLNFIWVLGALGLAVILCAPRLLLQRAAAREARVPLSIALIGMALMIFLFVLPAMQLSLPSAAQPLNWNNQWQIFSNQYAQVFSGGSVLAWIFKMPASTHALPGYLIFFQGICALSLSWQYKAQGQINSQALSKAEVETTRLITIYRGLSVYLFSMMLLMMATRQFSGSHHLIMLWPAPHLHLLLSVYILLRRMWPKHWKMSPQNAGYAAMTIAVVAHWAAYLPVHVALIKGWQDQYSYRGVMDPAVYKLAAFLSTRDEPLIAPIDWGLNENLVSLVAQPQRARLKRWNVFFSEPYSKNIERNEWLYKEFVARGPSLYIAFQPAESVTPGSRQNLATFFAAWPGCASLIFENPALDGRPLHQVWRFDPSARCAVPKL